MVIEALTGPPGSGKTACLLDAYRAALADANSTLQPGSALWLAPTYRAAQEIRDRLLTPTLGIVFRPNVLTFDAFAQTVLQAFVAPPASGGAVSALGSAAQRSLLRRIVAELLQAGKLPYFAGIAGTSGFLDQVSRLIAELKRQETWPEDLDRACQARGMRPRDAELSRIYTEYQSRLLKHGWYDAEGLFWSAREALKRGQWGRFQHLSLVVMDGFTDFTHNQFEILQLLARKSGRLLLSLLSEPRPRPSSGLSARHDLFAKTQGVLERLQGMSGVAVAIRECSVEVDTRSESADGSSLKAGLQQAGLQRGLRQIVEHLFRNPLETPRSAQFDGIEILAVAGQLGEVQMLAAKVKHLLLAGVPAREIVVGFRGLADYAGLVDEVFSSAGVPYASEAGLPLSRTPLVKALLSLLQCEVEDWPFERLMGVLNSNSFQPVWEEYAGGAAVRDVAATLRRMRMHSQRHMVLNALEREAARTTAPSTPEHLPASLNREQVAAVRAWGLLNRLSQVTAPLRQSQTIEGWSTVLEQLVYEVGLLRASRGVSGASESELQEAESDGRAWQACLQGLHATAHTARICPSGSAQLTLAEFLHEFTDLLHAETLSPLANEAGRVRVLEAAQIRNLNVPYLFLAGLGERSFPRHAGDDCLYSQAERQVLNEHGLAMGQRAARNQEEMLLFYGVVTRARRQLVLSYPAVGANGQPLSPSPYVGAVIDLFTPGALTPHLEEQLDPVPPRERLLSTADLRVRGMHEALANRPELFGRLFREPPFAATARNVLAAVDLNVQRFHTPGFTPFEGRLASVASQARLRARYSGEHEFSASQLEGYAQCPFRFFLQQVLRLDPFEAPGDVTDYAARGDLVHRVLAKLHGELTSAGLDPAAAAETIGRRFSELLADELWRYFGNSDLERVLGRIEQQLVGEWGTAYVEQWQQYHAATAKGLERPLQPRHLERTFGKPHSSSDDSEASQPPIVFQSGKDEVRVCGKIDRVDVGAVDGRDVFAVIDYKTGKHRFCREDEIAAGLTLQLPLYTLATERLHLAGPDARPFQMGYWHIKEQGFSPAFKQRGSETNLEPMPGSLWDYLKTVLGRIVPRLAAGIRSGAFPVFNPDVHCAGQCPYRTVCRVQQIRALPDALGKTWDVAVENNR